MQPTASPMPPVQKAVAKVATKRIFFGHQSVGSDIIDGVKELAGATTAAPRMNIEETADAAAFVKPLFAHAKVGKNKHPSLKLSEFERTMDAGVGRLADIALLKFCYVDIGAQTDVKTLFKQYQKTMSRLRERYPKLVIVHVSVPLRTVEGGSTAKLLAKTGFALPAHYAANIKRNQFNDLLLEGYLGKEPVFDLAALEATAPDGSAATFTAGGRSYRALYPEYSYDGGHLTPLGRQRVAKGLLDTLSSIP